MQIPGDSPRKPAFDVTEAEKTASAPSSRSVPHGDVLRFDKPAVPGEVGVLGPYQIIKELGRGGMGAVYLATDTRLQRKVALKVMLPRFAAQAAAKERFLREARAAAQISHDNVVTVYEADERRGVPYIAMQILKGTSLDDYLQRKGNLPIEPILRIGREAAQGLAAAHKIGLVHRDIKPANLWLEAPNGRVKVLDFGLAKPLDSDVELTTSGMLVGTPIYMSPEQARGHAVDGRSDLFSLGGVLFRLCSGQLPFAGNTTMALLMALGTEDPKPLQSLNSQVPEALAELIHQMLEKKPENRPQSADDVARRLRAIAEEFVARPAGASPSIAAAAPDPQNIEISAISNAPSHSPSGMPLMSSVVHKTLPTKALWAIGAAAAMVIGGLAYFVHDNAQSTKPLALDGGPLPAVVAPTSVEKTDAPATSIVEPATSNAVPKPTAATTQSFAIAPAAQAIAQTFSNATAVMDVNRTAAHWVLKHHGSLQFNGVRDTASASDFPHEPFTVTRIHLEAGSAITDDVLSPVSGLTELRVFDVRDNKLTDAGLENLKNLKKLATLILPNTAVTGEGLARLKDLKSLAYVNLYASATDAGMAGVAQCAPLKYLCIASTPVSDQGLATLKSLTNLQRLDLRQTRVTNAGIADFHAAVPDCRVLYDDGVVEATSVSSEASKTLSIAEVLMSPQYEWAPPRAINDELHSHQDAGDPYVTADGLSLWFTDQNDEKAGMDIWSSHRATFDAPWEAAVNAGPQINTPARETMPRLSADGLTLTFWRFSPNAQSKTLQATRVSLGAPWSAAIEVAGSANSVAPVLSADGMELYMSIRAQIYRATRPYRRAALQKTTLVPELNGLNHQEPRWISPDGKLMLICNVVGGRGNNRYWLAERSALDKPWQKRDIPLDVPTGRKEVGYASLCALPSGNVDFYFMLDGKTQVSRRVLKNPVNIGPDRRTAEWVIGVGGKVRVTGIEHDLCTVEELPPGNFTLTMVNLYRTKVVSDVDVLELSKLPELRQLLLSNTPITDASMELLSTMKQMTVLDAGATRVTDAAVPQLKKLTNLTTLIVIRTKISPAAQSELHAALPACKIYHNAGIIEPSK